jgi:hypothetical protein
MRRNIGAMIAAGLALVVAVLASSASPAEFANLSGAELVASLAAPEKIGGAFAELYRRTEGSKKRSYIARYENPELVVCPQPEGPPISIVLCDSVYESPPSPERYAIAEPDTLFPPPSSARHQAKPDEWRKDKVIFGFSAAGEKLMLFGGSNVLNGYLFDVNGDGFIERVEMESYGDEEGRETADIVDLHRVAPQAIRLFRVVINREGRSEWGWALQRESDGRRPLVIGPKEDLPEAEVTNTGPDWRLRSVAATFRWNQGSGQYEGPPGSAAEHFIVLDPQTRSRDALAAVAKLPPFPREPTSPPPTPTGAATPDAPRHYESLGRGNDEANEEERVANVPPHLPERFWELNPKEAAMALVEANRSPASRASCRLAIDDRDGAKPPAEGEIGLEWKTSGCMIAPGAGRAVLRYGPGGSRYSLAQVTLQADVGPSVLAKALARPRIVPVPDNLARHVYETVWWLGRVRTQCAPNDSTSRIVSTADGRAKFWVLPKAQPPIEVTTFAGELSTRWEEGYDRETHATFAALVLRKLQDEKLGSVDRSR